MVDNASEIDPDWLAGHDTVGITAGASAPEVLVREVVDFLKRYGADSVDELEGTEETLSFPLPKGLKQANDSPNNDS